MIECRSCDFVVAQKMRHALISNVCPSCGSALLGEVHRSRLNLFKQKLSNQSFSSKLSSDDIFDISLFMLVEFFPPINDQANDDDDGSSEKNEAEELGETGGEETYEDIREQVREQILKDVPDSNAEDLNEDLRIERLKRLAKESPLKQSKTVVRRVGS